MIGVELNKTDFDALNLEVTKLLLGLNSFNSKFYCNGIKLKNGNYLLLKPKKEDWLKKISILNIQWEYFNKSDLNIPEI